MSLLSPTVESKFVSVDAGDGAMTLLVILNGPDGPVALQLIDRTQKAQPRTIEFTQADWQDLLTKIQTAYESGSPHEGN